MTRGGHWTPQEAEEHINYLELMAAFFSLQAFVTNLNNKHVRLKIDNTTAVAAINNMGTNCWGQYAENFFTRSHTNTSHSMIE